MYGSFEGRLKSHTVFVLGALVMFACDEDAAIHGAEPQGTSTSDAGRLDSGRSDAFEDTSASIAASSEAAPESDSDASSPLPSSDATGVHSMEATPTGSGSDVLQGSDSHTSDASVDAGGGREGLLLDGGTDSGIVVYMSPNVPSVPAMPDLFAEQAIVLDEQALVSCGVEPSPPQAEFEPNCDVCSEDLRACLVVTDVPAIDNYFRAVSSLGREADRLQALQRHLIQQALLGVGRERGATTEEALAILNAALSGGLDGYLEGGLTIEYALPSCSTSVETLIPFAVDCDPAVDPATDAACSGTCSAASGQVLACPAFAEIRCSSSGVECLGSCAGECQGVAGACPGTCVGECELDGSAECPGECQGEMDGNNCIGVCIVHGAPCPGVCTGSCQLLQPSTCDGVCQGECVFTPASGECGALEQTHCSAAAQDEVPCQGTCDGSSNVQTSAECEATVEAFGALVGQCVVPDSWARYSLSAAARAEMSEEDLQEFDARMDCFGRLIVSATTIGARVTDLLQASQRLIAAREMWDAYFESALDASPESLLFICAAQRLPTSQDVLEEITMQLAAMAQANAELTSLVQ